MKDRSYVQHQEIWLQPWCSKCEREAFGNEGRLWCQDNVWDRCEECGEMPVKYVLATEVERLRAEIELVSK